MTKPVARPTTNAATTVVTMGPTFDDPVGSISATMPPVDHAGQPNLFTSARLA